MKVFIDSDIILDLLLNRKPFSQFATILFKYIYDGKLTAYTSGNSFSNLYYILNDINKKKDSRKTLIELEKILHIIPIDKKIVKSALHSEVKDFEDALQYHSAKQADLKYFITRNKKDYKRAQIQIMNAEEVIRIITAQTE